MMKCKSTEVCSHTYICIITENECTLCVVRHQTNLNRLDLNLVLNFVSFQIFMKQNLEICRIFGNSLNSWLWTHWRLAIYAPMLYTALYTQFLWCVQIHYEGKWEGVWPWKSKHFWALWNGIEPYGECHLGPKKVEKLCKVHQGILRYIKLYMAWFLVLYYADPRTQQLRHRLTSQPMSDLVKVVLFSIWRWPPPPPTQQLRYWLARQPMSDLPGKWGSLLYDANPCTQ